MYDTCMHVDGRGILGRCQRAALPPVVARGFYAGRRLARPPTPGWWNAVERGGLVRMSQR